MAKPLKETKVTVHDTKGRPVQASYSFNAKLAHKAADEEMKRGYTKTVETKTYK